MDAATKEIVQGVTLEAISAPDLPDTESLLGEAGTMYLVAEAAAEEELGPAGPGLDAEHPGRLALAVADGTPRISAAAAGAAPCRRRAAPTPRRRRP